ncbi:MAG TPA: flavin reductase family protein [Planctomycetaceae bacterium]|nr:flavin reductase family protein [Planctomycetaceae bacterium]
MTEAADFQEPIASVLGRTPSGLFIVTVANPQGQETGVLASWVQQASFDPPMLTVAVNAKRYINTWLEDHPIVGLNVIAVEQTQFLKHFGAGFAPDEPAFGGISLVRSPRGLPMLADALCWMEGSVQGRLTTGDHVLYAVQITAANRGPQFNERQPYVHIRKNGFRY